MMKLMVIALAGALAFAGVAVALDVQASSHGKSREQVRAGATATPVLVELFTSEGCSSCPPADDVLQKLKAEQSVSGAHIIALGQHVDYWNRLGWTDPYSSHDFSDRQNRYAGTFHSDSVYTPQMVVDGKTEFVGSDAGKARSAIAEAARQPKPAQISLSGDAEKGIIQIAALPAGTLDANDTADVYFAVTEDNLSTEVKNGENGGRRLTHAAVTRQLTKVGSLKSGEAFSASAPVTLSPNGKSRSLSLVAFVQERQSRRILGATEKNL